MHCPGEQPAGGEPLLTRAQPSALRQPGREGCSQGGGSTGRGHVLTFSWFTLYNRIQHNIARQFILQLKMNFKKQLNFKNGQDITRHLTKEYIQMAVSIWKDVFNSICHIWYKTMRYHYTPIRMAKTQNKNTTKCWWGCGAIGILIYYWWKSKMTATWKFSSFLGN